MFWKSEKNNWSARWEFLVLVVRIFSGNLLDKNDETNGSQVEAEGAARRKAEARAVEAEGRAQVKKKQIHL